MLCRFCSGHGNLLLIASKIFVLTVQRGHSQSFFLTTTPLNAEVLWHHLMKVHQKLANEQIFGGRNHLCLVAVQKICSLHVSALSYFKNFLHLFKRKIQGSSSCCNCQLYGRQAQEAHIRITYHRMISNYFLISQSQCFKCNERSLTSQYVLLLLLALLLGRLIFINIILDHSLIYKNIVITTFVP